uniref:Zinc finger protein 710 n=1 Tax=Denticeps clupeoides TaxID=299321 RepID=A0AAY4BRL6_9TELE
MEQSVDAGTQTDPVVVLSLAQAAVLGLISQNEIFGATIAPNGFYTGEGREPPPPSETTEYEYADQLIGANGDYLAEPLDEEQEWTNGDVQDHVGKPRRQNILRLPHVTPAARAGWSNESYCVDVGEGLKRWKCRMCEKSYTSKYNLVTHILGHNGIKPHECLHCGKLFKQPSHLQTHLLTHQGTRPHKCTVCKKAFTQTSHLKRHICRFCGRGFAYPSELRSHEAKHENGHCHVCTQCGLEFPTHAHLKRHQASHQGPSTYQCTECHKSFAYRSQLQNHLMKHQNVRPFVCPECGMEFRPNPPPQAAVEHKGMKEFKCDVCSREFTLSANLKRHMLIHTSVRPFQCHVCFKTFVQKQTLKTHMIVHLPVKPFKCKVCGKSFNRMYNLLGHMHLHAGSKPFKCPYCSSKFNLKGNLSRHMKVKHGILDVSPDGQGEKRGHLLSVRLTAPMLIAVVLACAHGFLCLFPSSDALPDMEGQEEYEEESFEFSERENLASNNAQEMGKLAELAYYSYSKAATRYSTP